MSRLAAIDVGFARTGVVIFEKVAWQWRAIEARCVVCPIKVVDIVVHKNPEYPNKVKARGVTGGAIYEVDEDGEPV